MVERCRCGAELLGSLHFCVRCGQQRPPVLARQRAGAVAGRADGRSLSPAPPAPPRPHVAAAPAYPPPWAAPASWGPAPATPSRTPWMVASLVLVTAILAGAALLVLRPGLLQASASAAPAPAAVPVVVAPAAAPVVVPPTSWVPTYIPTAAASLAEQVAADSARVAATTGYWVPQLSSKRAGTSDGGVTYDEPAILDHYRGLAARYPGAALLWSGDWPVFRNGDYWVVVVAQPFTTAAGANAWCDAQGLGADDCFAKKLSATEGPQGSTVHR
ncbi:hypothetical protein [Pseudonocardia spirodelae]|uniref:Serine/threonine protein kinase n=1 Tax=Pseudonocardia spirodelae TaxID=3133431 RepID=A0ABU8TCT9_9PSEU